MLKNLIIKNLALIEDLDLELFDGFSVLTGETGAGKSIIIEALNFVLGERASRELIMSGSQKATVEARFALTGRDPVLPVLKAYEIEPEDGELCLYRELTQAGKNVCRIGGMPVSTAVLKSVGDALVDIHGQHAHQQLLNEKLHRSLLDAYAGERALTLQKRVSAAFAEMRDAEKKLNSAEMSERDRERRIDLLSYQVKEIDDAKLVPGEEETLLDDRKKLQNAQAIMEALDACAEGLSGEEGALGILSSAMRSLDGIAPLAAEYREADDRFKEAYYSLEDVSESVRALRNDFSYDPESLDQMEWRLETISTLKRKYGDNIDEILAYRDKSAEECDILENSAARREHLVAEYDQKKTQYTALAEELTSIRKNAAEALAIKLLPELSDLGMPHAAFEVSILPSAPTAHGTDEIEFLLSTNLGEPVKPLSKVASGGEIARIMLGFKSVFSNADGVMTMVFDEIDTGISGRIGTAVAEKMYEIAAKRQVLSITHLPQIAAYADHQYYVYKETLGGKTRSTAALLKDTERAKEIARIMGSNAEDQVAVEHAKKLISEAPRRPE